jgi:hypothetical protein
LAFGHALLPLVWIFAQTRMFSDLDAKKYAKRFLKTIQIFPPEVVVLFI